MTWATSVPILVFLGLSVLDLGPMYATDVRQHHRLMPPPIRGGGHKNLVRNPYARPCEHWLMDIVVILLINQITW